MQMFVGMLLYVVFVVECDGCNAVNYLAAHKYIGSKGCPFGLVGYGYGFIWSGFESCKKNNLMFQAGGEQVAVLPVAGQLQQSSSVLSSN
jgi:hypothetical protein